MMNNIENEKLILEEWSPILETKLGVTDPYKLNWMSKYAHYHTLNESAFVPQFNWPAASLQNTPGMGNVRTGVPASSPSMFYSSSSTGSGDKFPSLLPLALQVAARTVGFDIVPVIPMPGPTGVLTYLDYVYTGGKNNPNDPNYPADPNQETPFLIKIYNNHIKDVNFEVGKKYNIYYGIIDGGNFQPEVNPPGNSPDVEMEVIYVGKSRIDGYRIFRILKPGERYKVKDNTGVIQWYTSKTKPNITTADVFGPTVTSNNQTFGYAFEISNNNYKIANDSNPSLVKALEDHIQGYSGAGAEDADAWFGNFVDPKKATGPMSRGIGEQTYYRTMGLQAFTKFVTANTYQIAATVTHEQIRDLNVQFGIDVLSMIENALANEISQAINKHILYRAFALGWSNHVKFVEVEGQNLNLSVDPNYVPGSPGAPREYTHIGKDDKLYTLPIPHFVAVNPNGASFENLWTLQRRIFSRILAAGNIIAQRGRRGPANFIVTNLQMATILQDNAQFTLSPMANTVNQNNGALYPVGTIAGMTVYVDPNMAWNDTRILVGRKGADEEPGLKFMPYLMAESIQTIAEGTMSPKIAVKTRYALVEAGFHPETMYFTFYVDVNNKTII